MRGFAIILVIIGHLIQTYYCNVYSNAIFRVIYSFHMPLFFFISGCVSKSYLDCSFVNRKECLGGILIRVINKALALLLPSVIWTILVPNYFSTFTIGNRVSGFWFLNTMFIVVALWEIINGMAAIVSDKFKVYVLPIAILCLSTMFYLDISRFTILYFLIFAFGHIMHHKVVNHSLHPVIISVGILLFLLTVHLFEYGNSPQGAPERIYFEFALSFIASLSLLYLFSKFNRDSRLFKWLTHIGKYTLGIYVCHFYLLKIPNINFLQTDCSDVVQFVVLFFIAGIICELCILIEKIIHPITYLYKAMYGKFKL